MIADAVVFAVLGLLVFAFALSVRYAVTAQHVWHAEHYVRRSR